MLRRRYLIPIRCNNGKRKMWPWRWLHHFDLQHWRWLHALMTMVALFRAGDFWHTHSRSPADKYAYMLYDCCPACRTYEIATRFSVVVICPIIKCLTVLEFSFILFDLCLFITIHHLPPPPPQKKKKKKGEKKNSKGFISLLPCKFSKILEKNFSYYTDELFSLH